MSHTMRGKWSEPGIPHKGWSCIEVFDAGDINQICGMCESQPIRFIHVVEHPDYVDRLDTGCICCENLTEISSTPVFARKNSSARQNSRGVSRRSRQFSLSRRCGRDRFQKSRQASPRFNGLATCGGSSLSNQNG
jgi:hypothetical protein